MVDDGSGSRLYPVCGHRGEREWSYEGGDPLPLPPEGNGKLDLGLSILAVGRRET